MSRCSRSSSSRALPRPGSPRAPRSACRARSSAADEERGIDEALDLCRGRQAGLEPAHVASVAWLTMFIVSAPAQRARTSEVRPASCRWRCNSVSFPPCSFFLRVSFYLVTPPPSRVGFEPPVSLLEGESVTACPLHVGYTGKVVRNVEKYHVM